MAAGLPRCRGAGACTRLSAAGWLRRCPWRRPGFMASRGPGDGYAGGCRRVQGPSEFLSVGTCAVLAPCLREARSCLVAAWCRGGCCPRGPAPGDLVLLLLATRAPYRPCGIPGGPPPFGGEWTVPQLDSEVGGKPQGRIFSRPYHGSRLCKTDLGFGRP